jgi:hypothetical protein
VQFFNLNSKSAVCKRQKNVGLMKFDRTIDSTLPRVFLKSTVHLSFQESQMHALKGNELPIFRALLCGMYILQLCPKILKSAC